MAAVDQDGLIVEKVLCEIAAGYPVPSPLRRLIAFDREHGQYVLIDEGWSGYYRTLAIWIHVEVADGRVRIHEDGTEVGIANLLVDVGIPKARIVLSFNEPAVRTVGDFAVA